jgi:hypothetical protein
MCSKPKFGFCTQRSTAFGACVILTIALCPLTGCSTAGGSGLFVRRPQVSSQLIEVAGSTNVTVDPVSHNQVVTIRPATITTNWLTNEVVIVNPVVDQALTTARAVNEFANPLPFSGAISGALALISLGLGWIARVKSQKAALLPVVIQGVELANSPEVKASIKQIASAVGLESKLNREVQSATK